MIATGDTEFVITIPLFSDSIYELSEFIYLDVFNVIGADEIDVR